MASGYNSCLKIWDRLPDKVFSLKTFHYIIKVTVGMDNRTIDKYVKILTHDLKCVKVVPEGFKKEVIR